MVDNQPSMSALNVARCRAIAAHDPRGAIRGADVLAEMFLDDAGRASLRTPAMHPMILQKLAEFSPGTYEYFIARTAYLDDVVAEALDNNVPQIVLLGAGYDTRAWRFADQFRDTRYFEVDAAPTQQHKLTQLAESPAPPQTAFISMDFTHDDLCAKLVQAGYDPGRLTLFVWEGVTYYLPPESVESTLAFIRTQAGAGSTVCFDYMIAADQLAGRFGAEQARAQMQATYAAEPIQFDLSPDQVEGWLADRGFRLVEHLTAPDYEARWLTLEDGTVAGPVLDLFGLVRAVAEGD